MPKDNRGNLIPLNKRSKADQREIQRKGSEAGVKARRKKKATSELIQAALAMRPEINEGTLDGLRRMGYDTEIDGVPTLETIMLLNVIKAATNGDLQAIRLLYDYGLIPDMRAKLERERHEIEREKISGGGAQDGDAVTRAALQFQTIAEQLAAAKPTPSIEEMLDGEAQ